ARGAESHAVGDVVEARFEELKQALPRDALGSRRFRVDAAELALEQSVDVPHLLLFAQLLAIVGEPRARLLPVLAGRIAAPVDRAFVGEAFLALEEELLPLAAAVAALVEISGHAFSWTLPAIRGVASGRGSRCAAPASRPRWN